MMQVVSCAHSIKSDALNLRGGIVATDQMGPVLRRIQDQADRLLQVSGTGDS